MPTLSFELTYVHASHRSAIKDAEQRKGSSHKREDDKINNLVIEAASHSSLDAVFRITCLSHTKPHIIRDDQILPRFTENVQCPPTDGH